MPHQDTTISNISLQRPVKVSLSTGDRAVGMPYPWERHGRVYAKGYVYSEMGLTSGVELAQLFEDIDNLSNLTQRLKDLNGFFAVIIVTDTEVFAAVDRVCSTPIQYTADGTIIVGDDFKGFVSDFRGMNKAAAEQYLVAGYTYGRGTVFDGVHQVLSGQTVALSRLSDEQRSEFYYRYNQVPSSELQTLDQDALMSKLHDVHLLIFERMVRSLDGRQAVVPLSGGYDSRLVVEMLAHFDHRNVLCVTWGKENFHEVQVARDVAKKQGMPWVRIENSRHEWSEWYKSDRMAGELELCGALQTIPYVQDNILIDQLIAEGLIAKDSVFISGNSGDFIEGGHILKMDDEENLEELVTKIAKKHQRLLRLENPDGPLDALRSQAKAYLQNRGELAGFDEHWEWMERQSKFVTKSIKPFEARGFEWRLPFWDLELMDFWAAVPRNLKSGRVLFYAYAKKYMNNSSAAANPAQGAARRYYDVLANGRYGAYSAGWGALGPLRSSAGLASCEEVSELVRHMPIFLTRINGLIALDVLDRVIGEGTRKRRDDASENATSTAALNQ